MNVQIGEDERLHNKVYLRNRTFTSTSAKCEDKESQCQLFSGDYAGNTRREC